MSWEVLVTANAFRETPGAGRDRLLAAGCRVQQAPRRGPLPREELKAALDGKDAVVAANDPYSSDVLEALPRLKVISRWGVGVDSVDLAAATRQGIVVAYTPGRTTHAVADFAFALLLALARRIGEGFALTRAGSWGELRGTELPGKTLGLIGLGNIGRAMARRAAGFDLRVLACDPEPRLPLPPGIELVDLDALLSRSDFVSVHAALTPSTRNLIDRRALSRMKPTAFLINTARGALVDEEALVEALREKRIAGAGLDVTVVEPPPPDHPFRQLPNCLLTPHNAFNTLETATAVSEAAADAIVAAAASKRPRDEANPDVLASPALRVRLS